MNFNLNKFVEDVAQDNELCREFSKFEEMDEIYNYCKNVGIECSEDEFDESISEYIYSLDNNNYKIDDDNMSNIAGGINFTNSISKTLAVVLSALTLGGSGFFGNINAEEVSKISNSSYKSEKINSEKWSRTKKAMLKFYNNHKKAIIGTGLTLGATIIAGGILYNNYKVNNYKKELSNMSDGDILKKIDKILPQNMKHEDSNKQSQPLKNPVEEQQKDEQTSSNNTGNTNGTQSVLEQATKGAKTKTLSHFDRATRKGRRPPTNNTPKESDKINREKPVEEQQKDKTPDAIGATSKIDSTTKERSTINGEKPVEEQQKDKTPDAIGATLKIDSTAKERSTINVEKPVEEQQKDKTPDAIGATLERSTINGEKSVEEQQKGEKPLSNNTGNTNGTQSVLEQATQDVKTKTLSHFDRATRKGIKPPTQNPRQSAEAMEAKAKEAKAKEAKAKEAKSKTDNANNGGKPANIRGQRVAVSAEELSQVQLRRTSGTPSEKK